MKTNMSIVPVLTVFKPWTCRDLCLQQRNVDEERKDLALWRDPSAVLNGRRFRALSQSTFPSHRATGRSPYRMSSAVHLALRARVGFEFLIITRTGILHASRIVVAVVVMMMMIIIIFMD